ncbi:MAG: DUF3757 domain-containing protein [Proteobacteria bacterium]|nr:DUF3757 domain-containing protein [Pseudomonadota bacterium]
MQKVLLLIAGLVFSFSSAVYADVCPDLSKTSEFSKDVWKIQSGAAAEANSFYEATTRKLDENRVYVQCFYSNSNGGYGFVLVSENPVATPNNQSNWQLNQNNVDYKCTSGSVNNCEFSSIKERHEF